MNKLICLVGLPNSGKTTFAKWYSKKHGIPIINPDNIRLAIHGKSFIGNAEPFVWATALTMIRALFLSGHDQIIFDATNTNYKRRNQIKSYNNEWEQQFFFFPASEETCIKRAEENNREDLIPHIKRMNYYFDPIEGKDNLVYIKSILTDECDFYYDIIYCNENDETKYKPGIII